MLLGTNQSGDIGTKCECQTCVEIRGDNDNNSDDFWGSNIIPRTKCECSPSAVQICAEICGYNNNNDQGNNGFEMMNDSFYLLKMKKFVIVFSQTFIASFKFVHTVCSVELNLTNYLISYVKTD